METRAIYLFILLAMVALVAILVFKKSKTKTHNKRRRQKEPVIGQSDVVADVIESAEEMAADAPELDESQAFEQDYERVEQPGERPLADSNEMVVIRVISQKDRPYAGYELLQALLSNGLRFGDMNIFHRHETLSGRGDILFSLSSAVEPGTFELSKMGSYSTPGLTIFMQFAGQKDVRKSFETLLETAQQLVEDLGGDMRDQNGQVLGPEVINFWRSRVKAVEQSMHTGDLFQGQPRA